MSDEIVMSVQQQYASNPNRFPINDIYPCIQGEGVQTGVPMVLVRFHGCPVACPFCDTKETWDIKPDMEEQAIHDALGTNEKFATLAPSELNKYITDQYPTFKWVLVTGGEPAQYRLAPMVAALHDGGRRVAIETSGTEIEHINAGFDWICVSPKLYMPGKRRVLPPAIATADEIKFVVGRERDLDILDQLLALTVQKATVQICLQPMSTDPKATALCIKTVQERGWRLSLQTHKFVDQR